MDPLSMTASIITLIGVGSTIGKALQKTLVNAPPIFIALNEEVTNVQDVIRSVEHFLQEHNEVPNSVPVISVCRILERMKMRLLQLQGLIAYELTKIEGDDNEAKLDRFAWVRCEKKVNGLYDQLRTDRIDLSSALSILASSTALRATADTRELLFNMKKLHIDRSRENLALMTEVKSVNGLVRDRDMSTRQRLVQYQPTEATERRAHITVREEPPLSTSTPQVPPIQRTQDPEHLQAHWKMFLEKLEPSSRFEEVCREISLKGYRGKGQIKKEWPISKALLCKQCDLECGCGCHQRALIGSPAWLEPFIGLLAVQTRGWSWSKKICGSGTCVSNLMDISYDFPTWLLDQSLHMSIDTKRGVGPELFLRHHKFIPASDPFFWAAKVGAFDHLKRLVTSGLRSSYSVSDPESKTALFMAVDCMQLEVIEFLMSAGSDPFATTSFKSSPFLQAWTMILGKDFYGSELELERLSRLFDDRSQISMFGFSPLHISCFGMSNLSIEDIISQAISPAVDPNDAAGRTPMSWAAQRGDDAVVGKLLSIGASPTLADFAGKTPLHWSVHAADSQCLERLLSCGADVEAKDKDGRTALCLAVHRGADLSFTETLLQHGANAKTGDWDRMTPLLWASLRDRPWVMSRLLEAGANVKDAEPGGRTALLFAIALNNYNVLRLLLEHDLQSQCRRDSGGRNLLHYAACLADITTLKILRLARLQGINPGEQDHLGYTEDDYADWRKYFNKHWSLCVIELADDDPAAWFSAFKKFMGSINRRDWQDEEDESAAVASDGGGLIQQVPFDNDTIANSDEEDEWEDAPETPELSLR